MAGPIPRRVAVLGGTRFIGAAILEELVDQGHEVIAIHRGETERDDLPPVEPVHLDRSDTTRLRQVLAKTGARVLIDTCAYTRTDAEGVVAALPDELRLIVLSSMDTYRQFHRLRTRQPPLDPVPLDEDSPTREGSERYGAGTLLWTRTWVRDVARAVHLAVVTDASDGQVLNIGERRTLPILGWAQAILDAARSTAQLTIKPDAELDPDLALTAALSQHILVDSSRARRVLGWQDTPADTAIAASVAWHLNHPPT